MKIKAKELPNMGLKEGPCIGEIQELIDSFTAKISNPRGECFEVCVSLGILLAAESFPVRLIRGKCCGSRHWWLCHHDSIIDPTAHQFDGDRKYVPEERFPMNFDSLAGYLGTFISFTMVHSGEY